MIFALVKTHPKIQAFFNGILQSSEVVPEWVLGMIVPLHKDGSKLDTSNYRGITLISCIREGSKFTGYPGRVYQQGADTFFGF